MRQRRIEVQEERLLLNIYSLFNKLNSFRCDPLLVVTEGKGIVIVHVRHIECFCVIHSCVLGLLSLRVILQYIPRIGPFDTYVPLTHHPRGISSIPKRGLEVV